MVYTDFLKRFHSLRCLPLFCAIAFMLSSCVSTSSKSNELSLEDLCNKAATEVSEEIEDKVTSIAILDVQTEYWAVSDYIVDELAHYFTRRLGNGNVIAHDEFTRSLIMNELDYQRTGMVSDDTIQEIGRELGVDAVIIGILKENASGWNLIVNTTQTETKIQLSSWQGRINRNDKEMKFQIEKSKKSERPVVETKKAALEKQAAQAANELSAVMINESGSAVTTLHSGDAIRFRVTSPKNAYLAILCIDAKKNEEWLPIENNYIRAGESRIFPDIPGAVLRVQSGTYGAEQVKIYASSTAGGLPNQTKTMGTRAFTLEAEGVTAEEYTIDYRVER